MYQFVNFLNIKIYHGLNIRFTALSKYYSYFCQFVVNCICTSKVVRFFAECLNLKKNKYRMFTQWCNNKYDLFSNEWTNRTSSWQFRHSACTRTESMMQSNTHYQSDRSIVSTIQNWMTQFNSREDPHINSYFDTERIVCYKRAES